MAWFGRRYPHGEILGSMSEKSPDTAPTWTTGTVCGDDLPSVRHRGGRSGDQLRPMWRHFDAPGHRTGPGAAGSAGTHQAG